MPSSSWITLQEGLRWGLQWFSTPSTAVASAYAVVSSMLFIRARKRYWAAPRLPVVPPGGLPLDLMVVIPARNEEGIVGDAVKSFPHDTVIVVNDHSTDKTVEEARNAGAGVLEAPVMKGAQGKANACLAGARVLTSRWILFADADTRYQEGFLESIVQYADRSKLSFVSVHLTPRPDNFIDRMLEPYESVLLFSSNRLQRDPALLFNGQCILALREAYQFIGGHAAIWKYIAEDLQLAMLARRHRMGFAVVQAGELGYVRSHTGWDGAWKRVERKAFRFTHVHPWISLTILLTALCAALWLPLAAWLWLTGNRVASGVLFLIIVLQLWPWYGKRVLLGPLAIYTALPLLWHAFLSAFIKKHVEWKGRRIKAA